MLRKSSVHVLWNSQILVYDKEYFYAGTSISRGAAGCLGTTENPALPSCWNGAEASPKSTIHEVWSFALLSDTVIMQICPVRYRNLDVTNVSRQATSDDKAHTDRLRYQMNI